MVGALLAVMGLWPAVSPAQPAELKQSRAEAKTIAAEISGLDAQIGAAVTRYSRATRALEAVRRQIRENRRLQKFAYHELGVARAALSARAVSMYKHDHAGTMDAVFGAASFGDLITQLTMLRNIARSDRDIVRSISITKRELVDRAVSLGADERTAKKLVKTCKSELTTIQARLKERQATLAGVRSNIRRLVAAAQKASPRPAATVEPPRDDEANEDAGGSGPWWPLIQEAAASNGVSARGLYRLMMIESGGSAAAVGPGGYHGLFQYSRSTWKGDWNPWRSSSITDGAAQIKATALAIKLGYGPSWWGASFSWAFQGD